MPADSQTCTLTEVSPPSTLYCLEPKAIGSVMVESLTSFLCRLAREHRVPLSCLLEAVIAPITGKRYVINNSGRVLSGAFGGYFRSMNGTGETAADWTGYLQQLTRRRDPSCLTLRHWRHVLSQRELLRNHKAWCPECFDEQLSEHGTLYEPLLWSIAAVSICPTHQRPLRSSCQRCQRSLCHLSRRIRPGYCYRCGASLRSRVLCKTAVSEWDVWKAEAVGRLLASHQPNQIEPDNDVIVTGIGVIIAKTFQGNATRFAHTIRKQKNTAWGWCNDGSRIGLLDLLNLCYCLQIDPLDFLSPTFALTFAAPAVFRASLIESRKLHKRRPLDRAAVEKRLRKYLEREETPSMQELALSLGFHKRLLYRHFPELCRAIARKHSQISGSGKN